MLIVLTKVGVWRLRRSDVRRRLRLAGRCSPNPCGATPRHGGAAAIICQYISVTQPSTCAIALQYPRFMSVSVTYTH
jgi:hypothetical protein